MHELSVNHAGSVEDFLLHSEKIGFCEFGVESRLWMLNEEISDSKNWVGKSMENEPEGNSEFMGLQISQEILDAFVLDALFKKEEDTTNIIERMFFDEYHNSVEIEISKILLKIAPPVFNPTTNSVIVTKLLIKPLPPERVSVKLLIYSNKEVTKSTAPFTKSEFVKFITNSSQAFFSLYSLESKLSMVLLNCSWLAPALLLASATNSIVRS
jgi:hypothetical protein